MELPNYGYQQVALFSKEWQGGGNLFYLISCRNRKERICFWGHNLAPVPSNHHSVCLSGRTGRHC